jgi:Lrp/AsnC family leucine-responsive transcriptional regulator
VNIDAFDLKILHELEHNGRLSNVELAERIGLSPSGCLRRVGELENSGVIQGYRAVLNREVLSQGLVVYTAVGLSDHSQDTLEKFEAAIANYPEVIECHCVTGSIEYLLRIQVADLKQYKTFHSHVLGSTPGVTHITSQVVMSSPKDGRAL